MPADRSIFPIRDPVDVDAGPSVVSLDTAGAVFESLTSTTARELVDEIYDGPATASDLAHAVDTTIQNVQYHLDQLQEAGLVAVVGTWYSERGNEMTVYGPAADPLVICAGDAESRAGVRRVLDRAESSVSVAHPGD